MPFSSIDFYKVVQREQDDKEPRCSCRVSKPKLHATQSWVQQTSCNSCQKPFTNYQKLFSLTKKDPVTTTRTEMYSYINREENQEETEGSRQIFSSKMAKLKFSKYSGDDPTEWFTAWSNSLNFKGLLKEEEGVFSFIPPGRGGQPVVAVATTSLSGRRQNGDLTIFEGRVMGSLWTYKM